MKPPVYRMVRASAAPVVCALGALLFGATPSAASKAIVLGDSIGVGVSMAAGVPRLAHNSVSIRSADALDQLRRAPRDSVAFISLGTNDAVGSIAGVEKGVDKILDVARSADLQVVWIGPPCVMKSWNTNVVKLDEILKKKLAGQVTYVSAADKELCDKSLRAGDGVHFNMRGYAMLWQRAREAAGISIESGGKALDLSGEHSAHKRSATRHARKRHNLKPGQPVEQATVEARGAESQ